MKLYRENSEVKEHLRSGALSLTNAAMLVTMFNRAKKQNVELPKQQIYEAALNSTTREAEKKMGDIAEAHGFVQKRPNEEIRLKMEQVKAKLSHAYPGMTDDELVLFLLDEMLEKTHGKTGGDETLETATRYVRMAIRRPVVERDECSCTYRDPGTGRRCGSQFFLQFHHIIPYALGGKTSVENLTLHCHTHNKLEARKAGLDIKVA